MCNSVFIYLIYDIVIYFKMQVIRDNKSYLIDYVINLHDYKAKTQASVMHFLTLHFINKSKLHLYI